MRATVIAPNCGKRDAAGNIVTDSADHRSHVAYPVSAKAGCPASHPIPLPHVKVNVRFEINDCVGAGWSLHADFWNTWNQTALINMVNTKLN